MRGLLSLSVALLVATGCAPERVPTATGPQAENQRAKTSEEQVDYLIGSLSAERGAKKNIQACKTLGRIGADAAKAVPELEKVKENSNDPDVRIAAEMAIMDIQAAGPGTAAP